MKFKKFVFDEGRYPIVPGTFARRNSSGEFEPTQLGELYLFVEQAIARVDSMLDAMTDKTPEIDAHQALTPDTI